MDAPQPTEITVQGATGNIAVRIWGPSDGSPFLAIHGWLDNCASFDPLAPLLSRARVFALDLPGHGRSDHRPVGVPYHFVDWVADVVSAADALGLDKFSLLGHSLGGNIALLVGAAAHERIHSIVSIEAIGPYTAEPAEFPARISKYLAERAAFKVKRTPVYPTAKEAAEVRAAAGGLNLRAASLLSARGLKSVDGGVTWSSDSRLRWTSPHRLTEAHVLAALRQVSCPVLFIRATGGLTTISDTIVRARLDAIKKLTFVPLAGSHHLHMESPESVAMAIQRWLSEI